jgi:hypothetical protein
VFVRLVSFVTGAHFAFLFARLVCWCVQSMGSMFKETGPASEAQLQLLSGQKTLRRRFR